MIINKESLIEIATDNGLMLRIVKISRKDIIDFEIQFKFKGEFLWANAWNGMDYPECLHVLSNFLINCKREQS